MNRIKVNRKRRRSPQNHGTPDAHKTFPDDTYNPNIINEGFEYTDQRYHYIGTLLARDDSLHLSQLSGSTLRASALIVSKFSGIALLMLWAVNSAGGLNAQSTLIVNCSDVGTSQLLTVCENIVQMVLEVVDRDLVTYEGYRQHDLFYELTDLVIGMKQQIQSFLSTKVGVSKAHQWATGMQNMFARPEPSLAMHLGRSLINIF